MLRLPVTRRRPDRQYISMARTNPVTGHGYVLVAHTAFEQRGKKRGLCMCCVDVLVPYPLTLPRRSQSK